MTRAFTPDAVGHDVLERLVDLASRAPSAGKTQGWHLVVLEGAETQKYWDITLPVEKQAGFRWKRLLDAPVLMLALADPDAYVDRYAEPDKTRTGLGESADAWPAPYWTIDASMAVMTLLLAAEDAGLGALFFGVFQQEAEVRRELGIPDRLVMVGAVALGHPVPAEPAAAGDAMTSLATDTVRGPGRSSRRRRRSPSEILHRGRW